MPSPDVLIAFFIAASIFAYMPGPALFYAAAQTMARGKRAGFFAALGLHVGGYAHVLAAALGLALLFEAVPTLYVVLKLAGAAYLVFLGVQMIRADGPKVTTLATDTKSPKRAFWQSVTVEVLNPKTAIFYVAFLPQFVDPTAALAVWAQLLILGTIVNVMFSSADVMCVMLAHRITSALRRSGSASRTLQRLGGGILIALGAKLALSRS
ncbi:LysE family translocator [Roseovarius sp. 2305UL8-3]|uniref:LysE family translocator n=1 Tax=Roseovarius conchicola TaxID=3121636 RepID=UPI0035299FA2